jgi:hypothetical protein
MAEPRNADALTDAQSLDARSERVDSANDLVTGNDRHLRIGQFAIDDMQVRAADTASRDLHPNLARSGLAIG